MKRKKFFRIKNTTRGSFQEEVQITKLDNGLLIVSEQIPVFDSFALGIGVKAGSRDDFEGKEGISHLLEHCVFRRTKNYESKQINELFEKYGAYANAFTTKEYTAYYTRALNHNFEKVLNLLSEIVFQPKFDKKDISKEKSIVKEEIRSYNEDPEEEIFDVTDKHLFQNTRLSHPIVGKIKTINNINVEDIVNFYQKFYSPNNIVVSYIGSLPHKRLVEIFSNIQFPPEQINNRNIRESIQIQNPKFKIKVKRQFLQSHISFALKLPPLNSKERYLASISNLLLGDCASSRLYKSIREKSALVYNVFSLFTSYSDCSAIYIYATTHSHKQKKTFETIYEELDKLYQSGFAENELFLAKEQLKSTTIMALENYSERLQAIIKSELTYGDYEPLSESIKMIDSITIDELNQFVRKFFDPNNWSTIVFEPK